LKLIYTMKGHTRLYSSLSWNVNPSTNHQSILIFLPTVVSEWPRACNRGCGAVGGSSNQGRQKQRCTPTLIKVTKKTIRVNLISLRKIHQHSSCMLWNTPLQVHRSVRISSTCQWCIAYYCIWASCCTVLFNGYCRLCLRLRAALLYVGTCRRKHVVKDSGNQHTVKKYADGDITCNAHWCIAYISNTWILKKQKPASFIC
jgi:hypothetical protein